MAFPAQMASNRGEMFNWWRHHDLVGIVDTNVQVPHHQGIILYNNYSVEYAPMYFQLFMG